MKNEYGITSLHILVYLETFEVNSLVGKRSRNIDSWFLHIGVETLPFLIRKAYLEGRKSLEGESISKLVIKENKRAPTLSQFITKLFGVVCMELCGLALLPMF